MFGRLLRGAPQDEQRAMQVTPWGDWGNSYGTAAGVNVSTDSALQLLTVYGATTLISDTIAMLPRDVFRDLPNGSHEEIATTPRWLEKPNATTDIVEFLTQTLSSLLLEGNAYWAYATDRSFVTNEVRCLNPCVVEPHAESGRVVYYVNGDRYPSPILHIKGVTRPDSLKGLSPVEAARQSIGIGLAVQEFAGNFYKNGTTVSGVIKVPGTLSPDQARDLKENWSRGHGGVANAHLPGVITNGGEWQQISVTPEQAQFLESRKFQAGEIAAQMFLLDPTMLGIPVDTGSSLTYANLEQRGIHLVQFTLMRWIVRLERAISFLLPRPQYLKFNVDALQRADLKTRYDAYRVALGANVPFIEVDEAREKEDLPPMPKSALPMAVPPLAVPSTNGSSVGVNV